MQEQLRIHRQILFDLALHYLEPLPGIFARLAYLAGLQDQRTHRYAQDQLSATFGREPVHETLSKMHEELFGRLLEMSLAKQEEEFRLYVLALPNGLPVDRPGCQALFAGWIPPQSPDYLTELFRSNLNALWELLHEGKSRVQSGK